MKKLFFPALCAVVLLALQCTPKVATNTASTPPPPLQEPTTWDTIGKPALGQEEGDDEGEEPVEYRLLDDVVVDGSLPQAPPVNLDTLAPYNPSETLELDLLHTRIDISFDWAKRRANGRATLTLRPWFYPTDHATIDAKNFDIKLVAFAGKESTPLKYTYDNAKLRVELGRTYKRDEEFKLVIDYTAKPDERESIGGSAAITSDKGLYFINADGADPDKPRQLWTQGETQSNSFWMPTIDQPNERTTQEMYITVDPQYKTLSNGVLASSKKNADGTRTDYWKMDKPHAPYLFMMAVGDFAVAKEKWRNIDLEYYVDPKYAPDAKAIFRYTPEMLEFFSTKLNYAYPWSKYAQIIVRDFVSGAMENTTAVTFAENYQKTTRELLDDHLSNEKVVAHEMFHHWFGDLVTTESWANLTLNEGFANYSEYLWLEHKYGRDEADHHLFYEQQGYLFSTGDGGHPLIHFGYNNREDMFDAHSYNKGGAVLHMLRQEVGDDAFFAALNRYLKKNEYTDVEAHELRLAFEDVTGRDLNWFFDQWFFGAGQPVLDISYGWDEAAKKASVTIEQKQPGTAEVANVFRLPLAIDLYDASGKARRERVEVTQRRQTFSFDAPARPALINADAERALLAVKEDHHTPEEWAFLYRHGQQFRDRWDALAGLENDDSDLSKAVYRDAMSDKFWGLRLRAVARVDLKDPAARAILARLAETDTDPSVRSSAIALLGETGDARYVPIAEKGLQGQPAFSIVGASLGALQKLDSTNAARRAKALENETNENIVIALSELYSYQNDPSFLPYFEKHFASIDYASAFAFFEYYAKYLAGLSDATRLDQGVQRFRTVALDAKASQWRRFAATKSIADLRGYYREKGNEAKVQELQAMIDEIRSKETDETLKLYYDMF
jgi:aminopeptidase N